MSRRSRPLALGISRACLGAVLVLACSESSEPQPEPTVVRIITTPDHAAAIEEYARHIPTEQLELVTDDDPAAALQRERGPAIAIDPSQDCAECFVLDSDSGRHLVQVGGVLGAQYGLGQVLEAMGVRFFSPYSTYVPDDLVQAARQPGFDEELHEPEMTLRGVQLHSLHPIEGLYAYWMPGEQNLEDAKVIADWYIKQRANHIQWVGLDDIWPDDEDDPAVVEATYTAWRAHTIAINDYLGSRGVRSGINIQLFGSANLQRSFDLLDGPFTPEEQTVEMRTRLTALLDGTGFDHVSLSFGEFIESPAEYFIGSINRAYAVVQEVLPGATVGSKIHLGNYEDIYVEYMGQEYLYYLLAQFADPGVVPWVHTVMYYNLFEDPGGAYAHEDFAEHRQLMLQRLTDGEPVVYFPETAYWVAFDNSVPTYTPIYIKSRFVDHERMREHGLMNGHSGMTEHVTFSSGFEWGYWQHDYAVLRMNWKLEADWQSHVEHMFEPFGEQGAALASVVIDLAQLQHQVLLQDRIAPFLAGRDVAIDFGDILGIYSQPDRVEPDELPDLDASQLAEVSSDIDALAQMADETEALLGRLDAIEEAAPQAAPWIQEIRDGIAIDVERARYVVAVYRAGITFVQGGDPSAELEQMEARYAAGGEIIARRHGKLWWSDRERLVAENENPTIYKHGYLHMADNQCYWRRERAKVINLVDGLQNGVPPCFDVSKL